MKTWFPWLLTGTAALWLLAALPQPAVKTFDTAAFGQLPALLEGRVQPLDSVARNTLLQIRGKQSVYLGAEGKLSAIEWLLETSFKPETAAERKVFRIDHPEMLSLLRLPESEKYFAYNQLRPHFEEISKQAERASGLPSASRSAFERQAVQLNYSLVLCQRLKNLLRPEESADLGTEIQQYLSAITPGVEASKAREAGQSFDTNALKNLAEPLMRWQKMDQMAYAMVVPPPAGSSEPAEWDNIGANLMSVASGGTIHPAITAYAAMAKAYRAGAPAEFNRAVASYRDYLAKSYPEASTKCEHEHFYNRFQAFYKAIVLYVASFLLACGFWFAGAEWMRRSAFQLATLAWLIHTAGLVYRMALEGRPPVTNLYSSAVFIGWGAVVLGWILERIHRDGIGIAAASSLGFATLIIAHNLSLGGDTMQMMRAVLDSNFWLATHVVIITLGYSSAFFAGFLGCIYILRGFFSKSFTPALARKMSAMVYGTLCFTLLFSFAGTVLGGIWADQSWGRFWGWDPKENGALIIVLWNAIILHARWGGIVCDRGLMNMAIFGNIVTSFSWFGVNMLGVGLHSYGFMDSAALPLYLFIASQLALIGLGCVPFAYWKSGELQPPAPTTAPTAKQA